MIGNSENRPFSVNISVRTDKEDYNKNTYRIQFLNRDHSLTLDHTFSEAEFEQAMKVASDVTYFLAHNREPNPDMAPRPTLSGRWLTFLPMKLSSVA